MYGICISLKCCTILCGFILFLNSVCVGTSPWLCFCGEIELRWLWETAWEFGRYVTQANSSAPWWQILELQGCGFEEIIRKPAVG